MQRYSVSHLQKPPVNKLSCQGQAVPSLCLTPLAACPSMWHWGLAPRPLAKRSAAAGLGVPAGHHRTATTTRIRQPPCAGLRSGPCTPTDLHNNPERQVLPSHFRDEAGLSRPPKPRVNSWNGAGDAPKCPSSISYSPLSQRSKDSYSSVLPASPGDSRPQTQRVRKTLPCARCIPSTPANAGQTPSR